MGFQFVGETIIWLRNRDLSATEIGACVRLLIEEDYENELYVMNVYDFSGSYDMTAY